MKKQLFTVLLACSMYAFSNEPATPNTTASQEVPHLTKPKVDGAQMEHVFLATLTSMGIQPDSPEFFRLIKFLEQIIKNKICDISFLPNKMCLESESEKECCSYAKYFEFCKKMALLNNNNVQIDIENELIQELSSRYNGLKINLRLDDSGTLRVSLPTKTKNPLSSFIR